MEVKDAYETAQAQGSAERVKWSEHELIELAKAFAEERRADPLSPAHEVFNVGMKKALPEHRWRTIVSMAAVANVRAKIEALWLEEMTKQSPDPIIVHVENQAPPDFVDILHRCDLPSLIALSVAKIQEQLGTLKPLLSALTPPGTAPAGAPLQAPISLLTAASAKPRKTRVLIVGPFLSQFREIETKVAEQSLPVDLIWLDKDKNKNNVPVSADYVIATEFIQHKLNEALKTQIPKGKYFFLQGTGITAVVNKLRDIGSLLPPRA